MSPRTRISQELSEHQRACRACTRCVDDGTLPEAAPVFEGGPDAAFFLVGQAPGPVEREARRPFMGRAGKELARWVERAGFRSQEEFRRVTYMASLIRCFPGRNAKDTGDRPPPARAIRNCEPWLTRELELIRPRLIILVGGMAIAKFLGRAPLEERVGMAFGEEPVYLPLPHPSGQSRWLNARSNRDRLERALGLLSEYRERWTTAGS